MASDTVARHTPHQLDSSQTTQACKVLLKHISAERQRREAQSSKPNLLADGGGDDDDEQNADDQDPIWLILTTKQHIVDKKRLKPAKITLPHPINTSTSATICLITADSKSTYESVINTPSFPAHLKARIDRILPLTTLKKNYKTFESRRALYASHDLFLADDRVIVYLPGLLGKIFYKGGAKRPIPVSIAAGREKGTDGKRIKLDPATAKKAKDKEENRQGAAAPEAVAKEIEKALGSALINLAPGTSTAVKVARAGMSVEQVVANVSAVVDGLVERFVTKKWKNVRAIHVKGPNTLAFPVWATDELWVDDENVLEEKKMFGNKGKKDDAEVEGEAAELLAGAESNADGSKSGQKRKAGETKKPTAAKHVVKKRKLEAQEKMVAETKLRKDLLKKQKAEALAQVA